MIYLVFESSKGRKDLIYATTDFNYAKNYGETCSIFNQKWTYRIYQVSELETFYIDKLTPISTWKEGNEIK